MISAVDSSVILDILSGSPEEAARSLAAIRTASLEGKLIVCESVVAEIRPAFEESAQFDEFMDDWGLEFVPSSLESSCVAGETLRRLLDRRRERRGRIVADFLIGAHAQVHADRLLARDRGYLRDYFTGLTVWDPAA